MPSHDRTKNNIESSKEPLRQRYIEAFQRTFHQGQRPPLEQFLPPGPEASAVLVELIHLELEFRLARGEPARVEEYLAHYPRLAEDTMAIVKLVATEYTVRRLREQNLDIGDILERFPAYRDVLSAYLADANPRLPMWDRTILLQESPALRHAELLSDLSGYEILSELGRGTTGVVYKARQLSLPRLVALKMLHETFPSENVQYRRFRKEIDTIALLQHENIVQIHDVGEYKGRPFFTMEYLDGDTLAKYCSRQPQPPHLAAEWVEILARAMHAVHAQGIIHRDLKPSNVLRTSAGCLKIVDFGLARREMSDLTNTGDVLGTPSYMAPEQAAGKVREIGPATDVYALGAILYELLIGRPPFGGLSVMEVVSQVQESDPLPPRRLEARTPRDLETICLKCLRKEPHRRYASAAELADDLQRFRNGEAIRARPPTRTERTVRWVRRHPVFVVVAAAFLFAAVTIPLALLAHTRQLQEAFDREHSTRMQIEQAERTARLHAEEARLGRYVSDLQLAHKFFKAGDVFQLPGLLRPYRDAEAGEEPRGFAWHLLQRHSQEMRPPLTFHDGPYHLLAYSPDGRSLISGGGDPRNQTLQVRDLRTKTDRIRHSLVSVYPGEIHNLSAYAPLGGLLAGQSKDGGVSLWDIASGQKRMHLPLGDERKHLALSPDGRWLAVSGRTQTALWNGSTGQLHKILPIRCGIGKPSAKLPSWKGTKAASRSFAFLPTAKLW